MVAAAVGPSVSLQLEPLGTDSGWWQRWRREMALPPCRLVWIGDVVESPEKSPIPHVEALVAPLEPGELQVVTLPVTALSLLSVGRVLKEKPDFKLPEGIRATPYGGPKPERRFIGFEFSVDVPFDAPNMSVVGADELSDLQIGALAGHPRFENPPLCVVKDDRRRLVIIPCWEIFRHYYAHAQLVSRLIFQFPSWKPETLSRLLRTSTVIVSRRATGRPMLVRPALHSLECSSARSAEMRPLRSRERVGRRFEPFRPLLDRRASSASPSL